jgi:hypothetical protein
MNACESENLSANFTLIQCIKIVSRFFGPRYIGDNFFLGPNLVSFNRILVPYEISKVNFRANFFFLVSISRDLIKFENSSSTLTVVRLHGAHEMRLQASENGTQLVRSGKWKWFCDMFNSWRAKWLILNYSVLEFTTEFPFLK